MMEVTVNRNKVSHHNNMVSNNKMVAESRIRAIAGLIKRRDKVSKMVNNKPEEMARKNGSRSKNSPMTRRRSNSNSQQIRLK